MLTQAGPTCNASSFTALESFSRKQFIRQSKIHVRRSEKDFPTFTFRKTTRKRWSPRFTSELIGYHPVSEGTTQLRIRIGFILAYMVG
ncbi:hypothetical protein MPTK1_4g11940 [Marchantia polymorpha subsp. ruderalis]|uniref:Uncharacterized protein n=2 Tax=Marchantia polymorpha TaxID=3197 RepID=A0AAF6B8Z8_MARPO|nr:hypothetical protein MARPO_0011s0179 [Marchantia polymorpha]BBN08482.1 hypothetical protein Mp_4g11940 [Marchantia polymorpha subsp. ruderalis]|eukprot:PTQ46519.1 hypothetical protein MARPO_0011s0179 [Marchantia polymorpha]